MLRAGEFAPLWRAFLAALGAMVKMPFHERARTPSTLGATKPIPGEEQGRSPGTQMPASARAVNVEDELCHPRAHLKACLLLLIAASPAHGYQLRDSVRAFGYERDGPGPVYRALRWLQGAELLHADWVTGDGPARRMFSLTPAGERLAEACARRLLANTEALRHHLVECARKEAADRCRHLDLRPVWVYAASAVTAGSRG